MSWISRRILPNTWANVLADALALLFVAVYPLSAQDSLQEILDRGDRYFLTCEDEFHRSIEEYKKALKIDPNHYEAHWKISRSLFYIGYLSDDREKQKKYGEEGYKVYGTRAVELGPDRAEGHLYRTVSLGIHIRGIGVVKAVLQGLDREYYHGISRAAELGPSIDDGYAIVSLGRYYYELPWPLRDIDKSLEYYQQGLQYDFPPYRAATRFLMAESYLKEGEKGKAREQLEFIFTIPADPNVPDCEEEYYRRRAQKLLNEID